METDHKGREFLLLDRQQVINIIENMTDAVVVLSPDATVWYVNKALVHMTGWTDQDLNGNPFGKMIPDDEFTIFIMLQQMITKGPIRDYETCFLSREGEKIPVLFNGSVLRDENGKMLGLVGVARDSREIKGLIMKLEEANISLEHKVKKRTAELEKAYNELKSKETQLIQSEKMASLGQLAAGVAHEINNPMAFINSNLGALEQYIQDFIGLVNVYSDVAEQLEGIESDKAKKALQGIKRYMDDHDLKFVAEDSIKVIKECEEGTARVKRIVMDLKDFSHVDKAEKSLFCINMGIESTLNIVNNELKYKARIVKEYGDIPEIPCYPMELNQVFMNLLVNASHAISTSSTPPLDKGGLGGVVKVKTFADADNVYVEIEDNGCGIPDEVKSKIFEPFFTTKEVGKGTGLGLSISYGIIKRHNGEILVASKVGKGTKFRIRLPIK